MVQGAHHITHEVGPVSTPLDLDLYIQINHLRSAIVQSRYSKDLIGNQLLSSTLKQFEKVMISLDGDNCPKFENRVRLSARPQEIEQCYS